MITKVSAGKRGTTVRSDCFIEMEINNSDKNNVEIKSKVAALYGESIRHQIDELIKAFDLSGVNILLEDAGALPFVIAARFEAAVKRLKPETTINSLPEPAPSFGKIKPSFKDRLRRSRLYLPGNEPKFFVNAGLHQPDGLILDLEDSVAPDEKDAARLLVRNALRSIDFYGAERMVRINQLPRGLDDLRAIIPQSVDVVLLPKCEAAGQILSVVDMIEEIKKECKLTRPVYIMPIIESALGVLNAYSIATAHSSVCSLAIGLEDYTADIGTARTLEGKESFFARSAVINAAKAAGIQAIDTVFSDVGNMEGLYQSVLEAKSLGFEGKGVIHPRQIPVVHKGFAPAPEEIEKAKIIIRAFDTAQKNGLGVVSVGTKMIDPPVVKRAQHTVHLAVLNNLLEADWLEKNS